MSFVANNRLVKGTSPLYFAAYVGSILVSNVSANAQTVIPFAGEIDFSGSQYNRDGTGITPMVEADEFEMYSLSGRVALPVFEHGLLQLSFGFDNTNAPNVSGGVAQNDTYRQGDMFAFQGGFSIERLYLGGFVGKGQVNFIPNSAADDADFEVWGGEAEWRDDRWSIGLQIGQIDSSAQDLETLDDATFASISGAYYFNDENTRIGVAYALADGLQDNDNAIPDDLKMHSLSFEIEHQFQQPILGSAMGSVYAGVNFLDIEETDLPGGTIDSISDTILTLGLRVNFGAGRSLRDRDRALAPRLQKIPLWLGAVPAVD